jgi:hypothetical protein
MSVHALPGREDCIDCYRAPVPASTQATNCLPFCIVERGSIDAVMNWRHLNSTMDIL